MTPGPVAPLHDDRIPVHVVTGFLGSGKTTFLKHLLAAPDFADTAVVINEFGEVGLDHLLVRDVPDDVVLLPSGCVCCEVGDDLVSTLIDLLAMAAHGQVPPFRRVVVETTGLADPAPILQAVMSDLRLRKGYRAGKIISTLDGVNGVTSLGAFAEAVQQVALADLVVITKADLAEPWQLEALDLEIGKINPAVDRILSSRQDVPDPAIVFDEPVDWEAGRRRVNELPPLSGHSRGVETFVVPVDHSVDWPAFVDWLELLLANRGQSILRVKGLLPVAGRPGPLIVHGVQHVMYPPEYLETWPGEAGKGWLVFIARNLTQPAIERSLPVTFAQGQTRFALTP